MTEFNSTTIHVFECDHMRPVKRLYQHWYHVDEDGHALGECEAGIYRVEAKTGVHTIDKLVSRDE